MHLITVVFIPKAIHTFLQGAVMGSHGGIGATYNIMPRMFSRLRAAFHEGQRGLNYRQKESNNKAQSIMLDRDDCFRAMKLIYILGLWTSRSHDQYQLLLIAQPCFLSAPQGG